MNNNYYPTCGTTVNYISEYANTNKSTKKKDRK